MTTTIRRGEARDAAALAELGARTFSDTFLADNDPADIAAFLAETFSAEKQAAELADASTGEAPACVAAKTPIEIARLYVARAQLGRGTGEALMARCVEDARKVGHDVVWLGVWERNARAIRFYERWGFRPVGEHVFVVGKDPQNDLVMRRAL